MEPPPQDNIADDVSSSARSSGQLDLSQPQFSVTSAVNRKVTSDLPMGSQGSVSATIDDVIRATTEGGTQRRGVDRVRRSRRSTSTGASTLSRETSGRGQFDDSRSESPSGPHSGSRSGSPRSSTRTEVRTLTGDAASMADVVPENSSATANLRPDTGSISDRVSLGGAVTQLNPTFRVAGTVGGSATDSTSSASANDLFRFSLTQTGVFSAQLSGLTGDADVQLIEDKNGNGVVDTGEILAWQWERGTADESIRRFLGAGDYLVRVASPNDAPASYQLETTFTEALEDDQAFSIRLVKRSGLDVFSPDAIAAIERAADFWENIISHSRLNRPQTFSIALYGTQSDQDVLAYAGPQSYRRISGEDRLIPKQGSAVLNLAYANRYNSDPAYLESVMRHELGHVFGLGVIWDSRGNDWVDQDRRVYRAESYAGQAYGQLLGQSQGVEIPLADDLSHWKESIFDTELMTPRAEVQGVSMPISQISIASLRDLGWNVNYGAAENFNLTTVA